MADKEFKSVIFLHVVQNLPPLSLPISKDRELRHFKEQQKQELKLVRVEVEMLPRDQRKEAARKLKEQKERDHEENERQFTDQQQDTMDRLLNRLNEQHRSVLE